MTNIEPMEGLKNSQQFITKILIIEYIVIVR